MKYISLKESSIELFENLVLIGDEYDGHDNDDVQF